MTIDVFTSTGTKKGTLALPAVFASRINQGLMHQALVLQQSNRRAGSAHAKTRGEVVGSTKKLYDQKHTGRARRGPVRSPVLRGGGKAHGPRNDANFVKDMPRSMRHAALASCLAFQAKRGGIVALENYPNDIKTKTLVTLLKKLPVEYGRRLLIVTAGRHQGIELSARNVDRVKTLDVAYLNPEDLLVSRHIIFLSEAIDQAQKMFDKKEVKEVSDVEEVEEKKVKVVKKTATKKPAAKKSTSKKSA